MKPHFSSKKIQSLTMIFMSLSRQNNQIKIFPGFNQGIHHPERVCRMHVIISIPSYQQQMSFQTLRQFNIRRDVRFLKFHLLYRHRGILTRYRIFHLSLLGNHLFLYPVMSFTPPDIINMVTIYLITPVIIYILKVRKCITYFISICIFACS